MPIIAVIIPVITGNCVAMGVLIFFIAIGNMALLQNSRKSGCFQETDEKQEIAKLKQVFK